ncbi:MAG: hypothetical protein AAGA75_11670 [Cyanobacteria bacterium P01_E01_bin.6]
MNKTTPPNNREVVKGDRPTKRPMTRAHCQTKTHSLGNGFQLSGRMTQGDRSRH